MERHRIFPVSGRDFAGRMVTTLRPMLFQSRRNGTTKFPRNFGALISAKATPARLFATAAFYILDYDQAKLADALRCMSLADGKEIWRFSYPVKTKRNHGMSRTVPTITTNTPFHSARNATLFASRADTGEFVWGIDLVKDFSTRFRSGTPASVRSLTATASFSRRRRLADDRR